MTRAREREVGGGRGRLACEFASADKEHAQKKSIKKKKNKPKNEKRNGTRKIIYFIGCDRRVVYGEGKNDSKTCF